MADATLTIHPDGTFDVHANGIRADWLRRIVDTAESVAALGATVQLAVLGDDEAAPRIEPAPDAEERPTRPRAARAAADGAGPPRKPKASPQRGSGQPDRRRGVQGGSVGARILDLLEDGPIVAPDGRLAALLVDMLGVGESGVSYALKVLTDRSLIVRDVDTRRKRTYAIGLPGQTLPGRDADGQHASPPARPRLAPVPDPTPETAPDPARGLRDAVDTKGLGDKLAARAEQRMTQQ